jgi:hypothetical protein
MPRLINLMRAQEFVCSVRRLHDARQRLRPQWRGPHPCIVEKYRTLVPETPAITGCVDRRALDLGLHWAC